MHTLTSIEKQIQPPRSPPPPPPKKNWMKKAVTIPLNLALTHTHCPPNIKHRIATSLKHPHQFVLDTNNVQLTLWGKSGHHRSPFRAPSEWVYRCTLCLPGDDRNCSYRCLDMADMSIPEIIPLVIIHVNKFNKMMTMMLIITYE